MSTLADHLFLEYNFSFMIYTSNLKLDRQFMKRSLLMQSNTHLFSVIRTEFLLVPHLLSRMDTRVRRLCNYSLGRAWYSSPDGSWRNRSCSPTPTNQVEFR